MEGQSSEALEHRLLKILDVHKMSSIWKGKGKTGFALVSSFNHHADDALSSVLNVSFFDLILNVTHTPQFSTQGF